MKLFSAVTDFVGFSMILIDFTMKKRAGNLKMMSYLFSMTEVAVESGSRSGSDEIHATLSELDEERVVLRDVDSQALGMHHF